MSEANTRRLALFSGFGVLICIAILVVDWSLGNTRAAKSEVLVKDLQQRVKEDARVAPRLELEKQQITAAKVARKKRDGWVAWVLAGFAGIFVGSARYVIPQRPAYRPPPRTIRNPGARISPGTARTVDRS